MAEKNAGLLGTIQLPRNLRQLDARLPAPCYNSKKPALKRHNSEPARLPSIVKAEASMRNALDRHAKHVPMKEVSKGNDGKYVLPPRSRRG